MCLLICSLDAITLGAKLFLDLTRAQTVGYLLLEVRLDTQITWSSLRTFAFGSPKVFRSFRPGVASFCCVASPRDYQTPSFLKDTPSIPRYSTPPGV